MKDNFQISEGDPLEFTLAANLNNGVCADQGFIQLIFCLIRIYLKLYELN